MTMNAEGYNAFLKRYGFREGSNIESRYGLFQKSRIEKSASLRQQTDIVSS
jgi:hypothetical protein